MESPYVFHFIDDTTPPEILNCPSDIQEMIELGAADPTIFWVEPRAMDLSETRIVSQSSSPGQTFPVGSTVVTYIFADTSDNDAICSFTVTVITSKMFDFCFLFINCVHCISM